MVRAVSLFPFRPDIFDFPEYIMMIFVFPSLRRSDPLKPFAAQRIPERTVARIPLGSISVSPFQPRKIFDENSVEALAQSIRQHGLLTPLLVRRINAGRYELIAGERRLRALTLLNRSHAEAIVLSAFDAECALLALVENLHRENLHYLDEAEAYRAILDSHSLTQEHLAQNLSLSPSALANRLRLLKLSDSVRAELRKSELSERHARALLRLNNEQRQLELIRQCVSQHLSVKQLESRIERTASVRPKSRPGPLVRDNRIIINAVLDTVKELNRIGVQVESRVEERENGVEIIVRIPAAAK